MAKKKSKAAAAAKPPTKGQVFAEIAEKTELTRRQVADVFDELGVIMKKSLRKNQQFTVPGYCKMVVKKKPATKARKGINPFTGEETVFKAKPARTMVKVQPLKGLKDMAE